MRKKINVKNLQIGMHLHEVCGSGMDHPFWRSKFTLTLQEEIHSILESGISEVWIDISKGKGAGPCRNPRTCPEKRLRRY